MQDIQVKFLLDRLNNTGKCNELYEIIHDKGGIAKVIDYKPFTENTYYQYFGTDECVFCFTSLNVAREVQRHTNWVPGVMCNFDGFHRSKYYGYWHKYLWNKESIFLPWGIFRDNYKDYAPIVDKCYGYLSHHWNLFIAPDDGWKSFTGQIIGSDKPESDIKYIDSLVKPDKLILVSPYRRPATEWRIFCDGTKIITGSQYRVNGRLDTEESAILPQTVSQWLQPILREMRAIPDAYPDPMIVVDVGMDEYGAMGIIELNSFSCSGFYQCDLEKIVDAAILRARIEYQEVH